MSTKKEIAFTSAALLKANYLLKMRRMLNLSLFLKQKDHFYVTNSRDLLMSS
jgi:hypothetical protein